MLRFILAYLILQPVNLLSNDFYEGDSVVRKGVYHFYNYEFDKAVSTLSKARQDFPDHPGVHLIWAASRWVKSQANLTVPETYNILDSDLNDIEVVYKNLTDKYPYNLTYKLYEGSAIGLRARVSLGRKQWLKTLKNAYRGFVIIDDVAEKDPQIFDALLPIGIIEYYAGISGSLLKYAVKIYGLTASKEMGLQKMNLAADKGSWSWIEAKSILSNIYLWVEDEPILALDHSKDLAKYFPGNFYFNLLYLESNIRTNNLSLSKVIIEDMEFSLSKLSNTQRAWYRPYLHYEKALYFFHKKNYKKSLSIVNEAIDNYAAELDIVLGNAYLLQGKCFDKLGKRKKAKESYMLCIDLDNLSNSIIKSKKYLKIPYDGRS